jgi:hypothetical protein
MANYQQSTRDKSNASYREQAANTALNPKIDVSPVTSYYHVAEAVLLFHQRALKDKKKQTARKAHDAKIAHNLGLLPEAAATTNGVGASRSAQSVEGAVSVNEAGPSRPVQSVAHLPIGPQANSSTSRPPRPASPVQPLFTEEDRPLITRRRPAHHAPCPRFRPLPMKNTELVGGGDSRSARGCHRLRIMMKPRSSGLPLVSDSGYARSVSRNMHQIIVARCSSLCGYADLSLQSDRSMLPYVSSHVVARRNVKQLVAYSELVVYLLSLSCIFGLSCIPVVI